MNDCSDKWWKTERKWKKGVLSIYCTGAVIPLQLKQYSDVSQMQPVSISVRTARMTSVANSAIAIDQLNCRLKMLHEI